MKYIAEQDRKFTDMGGIKIYHSIFPVRFSPEDKAWGPVIRFDNKVLLPGRQEVQHFIGSPVHVLRVVINGSADYFDSSGYRTVLGEQDAFSVNSGKDILSAVLQNNDDQTDTELLEIWMLSSQDERSYQFHSGPAGREKGKFHTVFSTDDKDDNDKPQQKKSLRIGAFNAGLSQTISNIAEDHQLIFFVFNGEVIANGLQLKYRDSVIFSDVNSIALEFITDTNLFLMEIGREVVSV
jgi:redox-sensitive bicupin YhaK (pirin superfamily)